MAVTASNRIDLGVGSLNGPPWGYGYNMASVPHHYHITHQVVRLTGVLFLLPYTHQRGTYDPWHNVLIVSTRLQIGAGCHALKSSG